MLMLDRLIQEEKLNHTAKGSIINVISISGVLICIPLFIKSTILPVTMIYFETIASLMHDISHRSEPSPLRALFLKSNEVHRYNTRPAAKGKFFQKDAKLEIQKRSFSRFGTLVWNNIAPALRDKSKTVDRKTTRISMFNLLSAEDDDIEINKIVDFLKS